MVLIKLVPRCVYFYFVYYVTCIESGNRISYFTLCVCTESNN